jgi:hypothetical protein
VEAMMKLKVMPAQVGGETLYHVVDVDAPDEQPVVHFTGSNWAEAEQYVADLGEG